VLTKLIHKGATLDDVAAQTGLSQTTIKRRLALNGLCEDVKAALALGIIGLSQAEAMTLGTDEMQRTVIEEIERGIAFSADDIKATTLDARPTVASAIFPLDHYTGTITTDLFAEDKTNQSLRAPCGRAGSVERTRLTGALGGVVGCAYGGFYQRGWLLRR
jgi:ParB family transcriptional regulator, chromosome partitioning protein